MTPPLHVGVAFHRAWAFWTGTAMVAVGVLLHLPAFASAAAMHYQMAGMPMGLPAATWRPPARRRSSSRTLAGGPSGS
jgi:hypothetical protein